MKRLLTLVLPLLASAAAGDELLPETPEGWSYERISFPLSFAPDLEYEGFEELRFAPGMFEPESDSYFSYVLALRIENDVRVDARFMEDFLVRYYRGLCAAVSEGSDPGLDLDSIAVEIQRDGDSYLATIHMFDAFVTGEPIELCVELETHVGSGHTEVLGLASPLPREAGIWEELDTVRERWLAERAALAFFNHLYVVPDAATYEALAGSDFLAELGVHETRTTVRTDLTYTGFYFYGESTYFEFLSPSEAFPQGSTGLAFGFEAPGGAQGAADALAGEGVGTGVFPITRAAGDTQVPWFDMLGIETPPSSRLSLFALEYDARFLESWHSELAPSGGGIGRGVVLERYAAKLDQEDLRRTGPFLDVVAVHLALDETAAAHLGVVCGALGYRAEPAGDDVVHIGPEMRLVVSPARVSRGVTGFELQLREPIERAPLEFGRARMTFDGHRAQLEFPE